MIEFANHSHKQISYQSTIIDTDYCSFKDYCGFKDYLPTNNNHVVILNCFYILVQENTDENGIML